MAKKKNQDEPEEEKDEQLNDDDDFGLPDLEFEELGDDDDFEDEDAVPEEPEEEVPIEEEMPIEEEAEAPTEEEPIAEETPDVTAEEESQPEAPEPEPAEEVELEDIDLGDIETEISDEELQEEMDKIEAEAPESSEAETSGSGEFYEAETFEEFQEKEEDTLTSVFGADDSSEPPLTGTTFTSQGQEYRDQSVSSPGSPADKRNFGRIVVIGSIVITIIAAVFYIFYDGMGALGGEGHVAESETPVEQTPEPEPEPIQEEPEPEPEPVVESPTPAPAGEITQLEAQTGKSYVVIGSFVDDDLAMDWARKLAADGESPIIIPPFGNYIFFRVAIAEFDSFDAANNNLGNYSDKFGTNIWALRY